MVNLTNPIQTLENKKSRIKKILDRDPEKNNPLLKGYWKQFNEYNEAIQILKRNQANNQLKLTKDD